MPFLPIPVKLMLRSPWKTFPNKKMLDREDAFQWKIELKICNGICLSFKLVIYFMAERERERDRPALSVWQSMKRKTMIRDTRAMRISRRLNCASPVRRTEEEAYNRGNIYLKISTTNVIDLDSFNPILHM
jgi:hypothetical protein